MKIVLLGYMGSGKTTIAKLLASALNFDFFDLDDLIEDSENKTITEIFLESGEIYFRKKEGQVLQELIESKNDFVLATGGGTPCYGNLMEFLKKKEEVLTVYLNTSVEILTQRLISEREHRPMIAHLKSEESLNEFIRKHLFERAFFYNQAELRINTNTLDPTQVVEHIVASLY